MKVQGIIHHKDSQFTRIKIEKGGKTMSLNADDVSDLLETLEGKRYSLNCRSDPKEFVDEYSIVADSFTESQKRKQLYCDLPFKGDLVKLYE
jgi:hypothetical protein